MIDDILRSTTNLYNQVAATIFSPRSTDDGHNESSAGRKACRQSKLGSLAEQIASALNYCHLMRLVLVNVRLVGDKERLLDNVDPPTHI
jgi:hypothetical protein